MRSAADCLLRFGFEGVVECEEWRSIIFKKYQLKGFFPRRSCCDPRSSSFVSLAKDTLQNIKPSLSRQEFCETTADGLNGRVLLSNRPK